MKWYWFLPLLLLLISPASAWLTRYGYEQNVTINGSSENLSYYPVMFTIHTGTGTSSGSDVYLNNHLVDTTNWTDLRITDTSDNVLPLYIEIKNSTQATVWVNLTSVPTTGITKYIYYGKAGDTAVSNGTTTFPFFDHFDGASLDTSKWTTTGTITISNSICNITGGQLLSVYAKTTNFTAITNATLNYTSSNSLGIRAGSASNRSVFLATNTQINATSSLSSNSTSTQLGELSGYKRYGIIKNGTYSNIFSVDFLKVAEHTTNIFTSSSQQVRFVTSTGYIFIDYIFTMPYSYPEPAPSTYSSEAGVPVANFTSNVTTGNSSLVVQFNDTSSYAPTAWLWNFGDNSNSTEQNPIHTYIVSGYYNVSLNATNAAGSNSTTKTNYIHALMVANFNVVPTSGSNPLTVQFSDLSLGSPTEWNWSFGDSTANSTTQNPSHTYTTNGAYTVTLTATNGTENATLSRVNYITVGTPTTPTAQFSGTPLTGISPTTVSFTDLSTGGPTSWLWQFGDGNTSVQQHPSHTYYTGTYSVNLSVSNAFGQSWENKTDYVVISEAPTPTPTPTTNASNNTNIEETGPSYVPLEFYLCVVIIAFLFFFLSIMIPISDDITGIIAAIFFAAAALLTASVQFISLGYTGTSGSPVIMPVAYHPYIPYISYIWGMMFLVCIINLYRIWSQKFIEEGEKK